jgi:putative methanogenesis marker protein 12
VMIFGASGDVKIKMFIGVDHGTAGIRFAVREGEEVRVFELSRKDAAVMACDEILREAEKGLEVKTEEIELIALSYSMGDGFATIKGIDRVRNRGLKREEGAGTKVGGGTKVFNAIKAADIPAIMIPGINRDSERIDRRMKFFSHGASPEKVGVAYHIYKKGFENFIFSDVSSNTVTVCVAKGVIAGAIDACLGSPGLYQGPIDLQLLRDIDEGKLSANEAFSNAGVLSKRWLKERDDELALDTLALFVAMEISAMLVLMVDYDISTCDIFLTGSMGDSRRMKGKIDKLVGVKAKTLTRYSAAIGCAEIADDVFHGVKNILGIEVEERQVV